MGLGALLIIAGLAVVAAWATGLSDYETTGTILQTAPAFACPGDPPLGEVFEGESVAVIGKQGPQWLVIRDQRSPGDASYVEASMVSVDGDLTLLVERDCEPGGAIPVAGEGTDSTGLEAVTTQPGTVATTVAPGVETTIAGTTATAGGATGSTRPRSTTSTTRPNSVTTTLPFPVAPPPSTTTTTRPPSGTTTTTRPPSTTSTTAGTTTTTTPTTTTEPPTTTTEPPTTTTEPPTTTTEPPTTTVP